MTMRLRKKLGKIRRRLFRTKAAHWHFLALNKNEYNCPAIDAEIIFDFSDFDQVVDWIMIHRYQFPWVYNSKEIECAKKYGHA